MQEIKKKIALINPVYTFSLTCEKIFTPLNIVKKQLRFYLYNQNK